MKNEYLNMNSSNREKGFANLGLLLLIIVLAVVLGAGYMVYNRQHKTNNKLQSASTLTAGSTAGGTITKSADINSTINELDKQAVDSDMNTSAVSSDLNAIL